MEIINKKEFATAILNKNEETFVIYMTALNFVDSSVYPFWHAQIALLKVEKVTILSKYVDYTNVFSLDFAAELSKHTGINDHFIDLIDNKQLLCGPIYSLGLVELEMLKTYIETNLVNGFYQTF